MTAYPLKNPEWRNNRTRHLMKMWHDEALTLRARVAELESELALERHAASNFSRVAAATIRDFTANPSDPTPTDAEARLDLVRGLLAAYGDDDEANKEFLVSQLCGALTDPSSGGSPVCSNCDDTGLVSIPFGADGVIESPCPLCDAYDEERA